MAFATATYSEKAESSAPGTPSSRQDVWPWQNKTFAPGRSEIGDVSCVERSARDDLAAWTQRSYVQSVAGLRVARLEGTDRQLDDGKGAPGDSDAPGRYRMTNLENHAVPGHKRHVDRKAHGERVNGLARGDDERTTFGQ